jgi:hypothetical protein
MLSAIGMRTDVAPHNFRAAAYTTKPARPSMVETRRHIRATQRPNVGCGLGIRDALEISLNCRVHMPLIEDR